VPDTYSGPIITLTPKSIMTTLALIGNDNTRTLTLSMPQKTKPLPQDNVRSKVPDIHHTAKTL